MARTPYSKTRRLGNLVFTSGHVGRREDGALAEDIVEQTKQTLANLEASLAEHGLDRSHIVRATVYLSDLSLWAEMNEPYTEFFGDELPTRSAIGVSLPEGILVEIDAVAGIDDPAIGL